MADVTEDTLRAYVIDRARTLIELADSGAVDESTGAMCEWIGRATWVLKELTRDAGPEVKPLTGGVGVYGTDWTYRGDESYAELQAENRAAADLDPDWPADHA